MLLSDSLLFPWFREDLLTPSANAPAGRTPLHYAAMHGRVDAVAVLARAGASVKAADTRGHFQPLHLAADAGQCEAISRLLALGADIEARTVKGFSPLVLAVMKVSLMRAAGYISSKRGITGR